MSDKPRSQKQRLLDLLLDNEWHTTLDIMAKVYCLDDLRGIARIGARIWDLRHDGYAIEHRHDKGGVWSYRLKPKKEFYILSPLELKDEEKGMANFVSELAEKIIDERLDEIKKGRLLQTSLFRISKSI